MDQVKYVCEIRYKPQPDFLDIRGRVVSSLINSHFTKWNIGDNRIELNNGEDMCFVSFKNMGFVSVNKDNVPVCIDRIYEAVNKLDSMELERWGVRIFALKSSKKSFTTLLKEYKQKLLNFKSKHFKKVDGKLVDVGVSYVFEKNTTKFHLTSGPMEAKQAKQYFSSKQIPKNAVFIDLDIYKEGFSNDDFKRKNIKEFIETSFTNGEEIVDEFSNNINDK